LAEFVAGVDKWVTVNEIRQQIGLEPIDGGDTLLRPISMISLGEGVKSEPKNYAYRNMYGKERLKMRFELKKLFYDQIKGVKEVVKDRIKSKVKIKKISKSSLFSDEEKRKQYWEYTVKNIEIKSERMRALVIKMKNEQVEEFTKKFIKEKPKTKARDKKAV